MAHSGCRPTSFPNLDAPRPGGNARRLMPLDNELRLNSMEQPRATTEIMRLALRKLG